MNYNQISIDVQSESDVKTIDFNNDDYIHLPNPFAGFTHTSTEDRITASGKYAYLLKGKLDITDKDRTCDKCGCKMHLNGTGHDMTLRHKPLGDTFIDIRFRVEQFVCSNKDCGSSKMQAVPFKSSNHRITNDLENYVIALLERGNMQLKTIAEITGLGQNTVKAIDMRRLQGKYTVDGKGKELLKPDHYARRLAIDEFKLHKRHKYATLIIDLDTGNVLWIQHGKKKQVVKDFIKHVGMEWMEHVESVACDMNSDFQEEFEAECKHITIVFDHFHIMKNFNEKVIAEVRKDEQRRLIKEGNIEEAKHLKGSKYILTSSRETLAKKDKEAEEGKVIVEGSELFKRSEVKRTGGKVARYEQLIHENKLLMTADLIKEHLKRAFAETEEKKMADHMKEIIELCDETENSHFRWFRNLISNHFKGIIAHARMRITSGKIEGINNRIKTLMRLGYGYPDDDYFFLKIIDSSYHKPVRNPKSHKIND